MAAVRAITETLNRLAPARLLAAGWAKGSALEAMKPRVGPRPATPVFAQEDEYERAGIEPPLEDMLGDPIVQQIMRADCVEAAEVRRMLRGEGRPT
jgi:hypothetical protein